MRVMLDTNVLVSLLVLIALTLKNYWNVRLKNFPNTTSLPFVIPKMKKCCILRSVPMSIF